MTREKVGRWGTRGAQPLPERFSYDFVASMLERQDGLQAISKLLELTDYGGVPESEFGRRLFDPDLTQLRTLPFGLLLQKEEAAPADILPHDREGIQVFLERLVSRSRNEFVIDLTVLGDHRSRDESPLTDLAWKMWRLSREDHDLFRWLLSGQHLQAYRRASVRLPTGMSWTSFSSILGEMVILWAANDVQHVVAILYLAQYEPLGRLPGSPSSSAVPVPWLLSGKKFTTPAGVVKILHPDFNFASEALPHFAAPVEQQEQWLKAFARLHPDLVRNVSNFVASQDPGNLILLARGLPDELRSWASLLSSSAYQPFTDAVANKEISNLSGKTFVHQWFAGLSPATACAVPILRFVQLQDQKDAMLARMKIGECGVGPGEFQAFKKKDLRHGWRKRAQRLLDAHRAVGLHDKDFRSRMPGSREHGDISENDVGAGALKKAVQFLHRMGKRESTDEAAGSSPRRAFYLLDILPDIRLSR